MVLKKSFKPIIRGLAHLACLTPFLLYTYRSYAEKLGADPIAELTHGTGLWALRFLLLCLAMTPLRLLFAQSWPIQYRRMLGLYAFFYASVHFCIYLFLDLGLYWSQIIDDIIKRPFITVGFLAWLCMLPLAITSTRAWIKRLGKRWLQLHRLIYLIGLFAILHFLWLVKSDLREPAVYAGIFIILMTIRLIIHIRKKYLAKTNQHLGHI